MVLLQPQRTIDVPEEGLKFWLDLEKAAPLLGAMSTYGTGGRHPRAIGVLSYPGPIPYQIFQHLQTQWMSLLQPQYTIPVPKEGLNVCLDPKQRHLGWVL